jgi:5-formyltetrahydrofolate cyclo-ligase
VRRVKHVIVDSVGHLAKSELRTALLRARRALPATQHEAEAAALCAHLPTLVSGGETVCAYVPVGTEPGSLELVERLDGLGVRVLLPVTGAAGEEPTALRWGHYRAGGLVPARYGLLEPAPPWLDAGEVATAATILVPALAVDRRGVRLGRGAGFYDRTLPLADRQARLIAVVRDEEVVDSLPAEPHDVPMTHALTPGLGVVALGESTSRNSGSST